MKQEHATATNTTQSTSLPRAHELLLSELGWECRATLTLPARSAAFAAESELPDLPEAATRLAAERPLYRHQAVALASHRAGEDVVLATGTGSGKTRVFHLSAAALLAEQPDALIIALYPGKALAREQAEKWKEALRCAGLDASRSVALITGDQPIATRSSQLSSASVAVLTPDVLHSWALARLNDRTIRRVLTRTRLVVLDEAHTLAGVFGSNTLYLLRRLQHALRALGAPAPRWIAASATLASPEKHLESLTGRPFTAVTETDDTSPRFQRRVHLVQPPNPDHLTSGLQRWLGAMAYETNDRRFVVFTQSRKHTELIAQLANRNQGGEPSSDSTEDAASDLLAACPRLAPYRSGLDPAERSDLQDRFAAGELRGLVCTSAFELGIDLPGLNLGFLVGLPESPASFWQRLGRFGRHGDADIFIIDDGSTRCAAAFDRPEALLQWRARDAALYPENPILLARHALCLAQETEALSLAEPAADPDLPLPNRLRELHDAHRLGENTAELRDAVYAQGNVQPPHVVFPLRHFDETYTFKGHHGGGAAPSGFITYAQILREAYPGAVYYHGGKAWRVHGLNRRARALLVSPERQYHTKPRGIPTLILPDLNQPALSDLRWSETGLRLVEAQARATEAVTGFVELRGSTSTDHCYAQGAYNQAGPLYRSYDTTAVLICHPCLDASSPSAQSALAALLREALTLCCPREAAEIAAATGALKVERRGIEAGRRFISLYDTVSGSLRLSSALADPQILAATLERVESLAAERFSSHPDADMRSIWELAVSLCRALEGVPDRPQLDWPNAAPALVFAPGTVAIHLKSQRSVSIVRSFHDLDGELRYAIRRIDDPSFHGDVPAASLAEIPGTTELIPFAA